MSINWFVKLGLWCQKHVAKFLFKIKMMKIIKWIIIILIAAIPMAINLIMWAQQPAVSAMYIILLSYYLGFQFYYYGVKFGNWFDSKLK